ncbi:hypothetical protein [Streptomyces sp. NPDC002990]
MSFGDPNNPYGQQPPAPQGQPGYGYPQQAPQGMPPQGGYAYPQQAPQGYPGGPAGYPGAPAEMPGGVKAARVILFILGILQALGGVLVIIGGAVFASAFSDSSSSSTADPGAIAGGVFVVVGIFCLGLALWAILTAAKMSKGAGGVRVSGIIYGSLQALFSGFSLLANLAALGASDSTPVGGAILSLLLAVISFGLGIWLIVGLANSAAGAYFKRPRY